MKYSLIFLSVLGVTSGFAQKRIPAAEWCAAGKKHLAAASPAGDADTRSDSVDIWETIIQLDSVDFTNRLIKGAATIKFVAKADSVSDIRLDLLNMTIDAIFGFTPDQWSYDGKQLKVRFPTPINTGSNGILKIYYRGQPVQDASGWGGFYWQGEYAYNLGVGFAADPHNFGRAWFPCFDNFVERCAFKFQITTPANQPAFCNGRLMALTNLPDGRIKRDWWLDEEIPSYLASVAIGPFTSFKSEYPGEIGPVPVEIAAAPADTNKLKASFTHLPEALAAFEHWYGPYRWNRIGYAIVPFTQGAMEHATNIAYMRAAVDGTTGNETLMAHELSHHWWGDLATCADAGDMWLNEGWAVFSEHLFLEWVYGRERYDQAVRNNFLDVLEQTHVREGGYRAVSGLPHELTYGEHTYNKGAVVAHNLRGYLGDSLFRTGLRTALEDNRFAHWNSARFRDKLAAATGRDLGNFFDDWVFSPGFTHFSIDSFTVHSPPVDTYYIVTVYPKQKLRGAPHFYQNVPLEFTFLAENGLRQYRVAAVSGQRDSVQFNFPADFFLKRVWLNTRQRLTLARAEKEIVATAPVNYNFAPAKMSVKINALEADSVLIRVEHHYAMPDTAGSANPHGFRFSNRFWTVDALTGFDGDASIFYDGKGKLDQLDTELFAQTGPSEDSIIVAYRPAAGYPWQYYPDQIKNTVGASQDRMGLLRIAHLKPGQYAIAKGALTVATNEAPAATFTASVFPNPASRWIRVKSEEPFEKLCLLGANGEIFRDLAFPSTTETEISVDGLTAGSYWVVLFGQNKSAALHFIKAG